MTGIHIDRPCTVRQFEDGRWAWRCSVCTADVLPYTSTAPDWASAYTDADQHIRSDHARLARHMAA